MKLQAELNKVVEKFKSDSERIHEYAEYLKKTVITKTLKHAWLGTF